MLAGKILVGDHVQTDSKAPAVGEREERVGFGVSSQAEIPDELYSL